MGVFFILIKRFFMGVIYDIIQHKEVGARMKKFGISAALVGFVLGAPCGAGAAYPVYQNANMNNQMVANGMGGYYQNGMNTMQNGMIMSNQNQYITANSNAAASPSRITGALPKVGSNVTAAGRQYYQPAS